MKKQSKANNHLTISINNSSKSSEVNTVDKKIKKIEQLKAQIQKITNYTEIAKKLYKENCKQKEEELSKLKEELVIQLYKRYQQKGFTVWQKELLESKITNEIDSLLSSGYESKIIEDIQEDISNAHMENMSMEEKDIMNDFAKEFFKSMGVDMDEEDFDIEDLKNAEFREQFKKQHSEKYEKEYHDFHKKNNEEKRNQQKVKAKATNNDFRKLYKNLVKKAHPDLVTNALEKEIREEWMKRLSLAWKERSYYELLLLEKEINKGDETNININESQAAPLIKELNEIIRKLEEDKFVLKHHDPNTSFYYENFSARTEKGILKKILEHKDLINYQIEELEDEKEHLKTQKSTKELLIEIRDSQAGFFDFSDDFFEY